MQGYLLILQSIGICFSFEIFNNDWHYPAEFPGMAVYVSMGLTAKAHSWNDAYNRCMLNNNAFGYLAQIRTLEYQNFIKKYLLETLWYLRNIGESKASFYCPYTTGNCFLLSVFLKSGKKRSLISVTSNI